MNAIILEAIQQIANKNAEANLIQQDKIEKLIKDLLNDWNEQKSKKFPPNPKSQLKALLKAEAKRQSKENGFKKLNPTEFHDSEGLQKILESHTIYKDSEKKTKVTIKPRTIKDVVREVNKEEFEKRGKKVPLGRNPIKSCSNNSDPKKSKPVNIEELEEKFQKSFNKICGPQKTGVDLFYEFKKKFNQVELEDLRELAKNGDSKDLKKHKETIYDVNTLIEKLLDVRAEMCVAVREAENAVGESLTVDGEDDEFAQSDNQLDPDMFDDELDDPEDKF